MTSCAAAVIFFTQNTVYPAMVPVRNCTRAAHAAPGPGEAGAKKPLSPSPGGKPGRSGDQRKHTRLTLVASAPAAFCVYLSKSDIPIVKTSFPLAAVASLSWRLRGRRPRNPSSACTRRWRSEALLCCSSAVALCLPAAALISHGLFLCCRFRDRISRTWE